MEAEVEVVMEEVFDLMEEQVDPVTVMVVRLGWSM